jgi:D-aspartate ligase
VNKQLFTDLAERLNLPVPETLISSELSNPDDVLRGVALACVLKPADSTGWLHACSLDGAVPAKALRADSEEQLRQVFWKAKLCGGQFVVQTFVPGGEEHLVSYHAYIGADRQVLGEFVGRKVRTYPRESGVSTCLELAKMPDVLALGREIVERLNMVGPVKIDFKRSSRDGRLYLLEVNARFTLWNYLGARCGVNLPALAHADLTGRRLRPAFSYRTGLRWISAANDLRAYVREYRSARRLSFLRWACSYAGPAAYDVFSWTDPMPSAASLALYARALTTRLLLGVPIARLGSKPH